MIAESVFRRRKKAAAALPFLTGLARRKVFVLPIANRLPRVWPNAWIKNTELMVVYGHLHPMPGEQGRCAIEFVPIVKGVDPQLLQIGAGEAGNLEPHERDVIDER